MNSFSVRCEVTSTRKPLLANVAFVRPELFVDLTDVTLQVVLVRERLVAVPALERLQANVNGHDVSETKYELLNH
jgi:hypothetical protein